MMRYEHTQRSPLHLILFGGAVCGLVLLWIARGDPAPAGVAAFVTVVCAVVGASFAHLTVRDEGGCLAVRFGPLPLFSRRIPYAGVTSVEAARSTLLDGWGIHWLPGRGWIYNLWGFDCVRMRCDGKTLRIGTDDVEGLLSFLREKLRAGEERTGL